MKKLLALLGVVAFGSVASTSVVACGTNDTEAFTPQALNGKSFDVKLGSFNPEDKDAAQNQWGTENTIGALYSTLWSINNKPAQEPGQFPIQNKDIAKYLTKGESLNRSKDDDGADVTVNGTKESDKHKEDKDDWHTDKLEAGDKVVFNMEVSVYGKDEEDNTVVIDTVPVEITITIAE